MKPDAKNIIEATNIHRYFGEGELIAHVLKGIDINIKEGEFVAIMGKSGAGKSTLMYQLSVLDEPSEGRIVINDIDMSTLSEQERTAFRLHNLGYVFQNYALVPDLSAIENVMLPLLMKGQKWEKAHKIAKTNLDNVGLLHKYDNLPNQLSGGEQQRVSIARAIAGNPKILFADEPTANLDSVSGQQVIDLITKLNQEHNQTVVMVTHEREYAVNCHRIFHLEDGLIVKVEKLEQGD